MLISLDKHSFSLNKTITPKLAAVLSLIFCLPFAFAIATTITNFRPFAQLLSYSGRATTFGFFIFYIGLIGLPLAFLVNLASMLNLKVNFQKGSIDAKVSFHLEPINLLVGGIALSVALIFGGHLLIDAFACLRGVTSAC